MSNKLDKYHYYDILPSFPFGNDVISDHRKCFSDKYTELSLKKKNKHYYCKQYKILLVEKYV